MVTPAAVKIRREEAEELGLIGGGNDEKKGKRRETIVKC